MGQPEGKALVSRLRLKTIPALIVDGALVAIGVQPPEEARRIVAAAPPKHTGATRHVGLAMSLTGRMAVHSSMIYLVLGGAALPLHGSLFLDGYARPAALHLFTLGFLTFLIYALGEHMLPRFTGNPIRLGAIAWTQLGLAHAGVWFFVAGFLLRSLVLSGIGAVLRVGRVPDFSPCACCLSCGRANARRPSRRFPAGANVSGYFWRCLE